MNPTHPVSSEFDKYAARVIEIVIVAILLWVGVEVLQLRDLSVRGQERTSSAIEDIVEIKHDVAEIRAAQNAHAIQDRKEINAIELRISELELREIRNGRIPERAQNPSH